MSLLARFAPLMRDSLAISEIAALAAIDAQPGCSLHTVADSLDVAKATAHRAVDVLVTGGLVSRAIRVDNRRLIRLEVTDKGHDKLARLRELFA